MNYLTKGRKCLIFLGIKKFGCLVDKVLYMFFFLMLTLFFLNVVWSNPSFLRIIQMLGRLGKTLVDFF